MNVLIAIVFFILGLVPPCFLSKEKQLLNHLLANYSSLERPVKRVKDPVVVTMGFNLIQLMSVVEKDQYITTKLWMRMTWKNELLTWNPREWDNISHTRLPKKYLWTPDIFLQEDIGDDISAGPDTFQTPIVVNANGKHVWLVPVKMTSSCGMDVTQFPFDRQTCKFVFNSWTHDLSEVDIVPEDKPHIDGTYINSTEWELVSIEKKRRTTKYACCPHPFVDILFTMNLKRQPAYYIYNIVIPCVVQMLIILFTFFLPADSGERIGVVITVLLVFAVYLQVLSESLPNSSTSTPALSHFYITSMVESAMSLIATCFVLAIHFKGAKKGVEPMPNWVRKYCLLFVGHYVWISVEKFRALDTEGCSKKSLLDEECDEGHDRHNNHNYNNGGNGEKMEEMKRIELLERNQCTGSAQGALILSELRVVTNMIKETDQSDLVAEEWECLATVVDRVMFVCFFIIFLISSLSILLPAALSDGSGR